jgi:hypothetical protein
VPGHQRAATEELEHLKTELKAWKDDLPEDLRKMADEGDVSVWCSLLHLAYKSVSTFLSSWRSY